MPDVITSVQLDPEAELLLGDQIRELTSNALNETNREWKERRRKMGFFEKRRFLPKPEKWVKTLGGLQAVYDDGRQLRDNGVVVWGQVVDAPDSLYRTDNNKNAPAGVIYSLDRYFRDNLHVLAHVGSKVAQAAKVDSKDATMQRFAGKLANQKLLPMRLEVPRKMTHNREVFYTTIVVHREQLPAPFLVANQVPLLVVPGGLEATMILPRDYWSETMKAYWVARYETRAAS